MPISGPMRTASERPAAAASATVGGTVVPGGKSLNFAAANSTATAYLPDIERHALEHGHEYLITTASRASSCLHDTIKRTSVQHQGTALTESIEPQYRGEGGLRWTPLGSAVSRDWPWYCCRCRVQCRNGRGYLCALFCLA